MKITVKEMVEMAMLIAFAIILDLPFLKIRIGANGGSISLTMVPLFVLALRHGPIKGFVGCGIIYSFLSCLLDGWSLMYLPFDYVLGYGSISIIGFFYKKICENKTDLNGILWFSFAILIAFVGRMIFSTISSIVFFEFSLVPALIYNGAYLLPDAAITLMLLIILFKPIQTINKRFPIKSIW